MSIDQFIANLPKDGWKLIFGGWDKHGQKRNLRRSVGNCLVCPLTCHLGVPAYDWDKFWQDTGLSYADALAITKAADGHDRTPAIQALRAKLLKHCGIK